MSRSSRPISLQSAIVIRRAQAEAQRRREQIVRSAPPARRSLFPASLSSLFSGSKAAGNDDQAIADLRRAA
jgi:hypothetical protein